MALSLEPVSIVNYTRTGSSIKWPLIQNQEATSGPVKSGFFYPEGSCKITLPIKMDPKWIQNVPKISVPHPGGDVTLKLQKDSKKMQF